MADQLGGFWELADLLKGIAAGNTPKPGTAIVRDVDADGTVWVEQSGTGEAVPANGMSVASVGIGDVVTVEVDGGKLSITGNASQPSVGGEYVSDTVSQSVGTVREQVEAVRASLVETDELVATKASIEELDAATARIGTVEADTADIATIRANSAKVANLTAEQLEADHATVGSLSANYAQIDLANIANGTIENAKIKDGTIETAKIHNAAITTALIADNAVTNEKVNSLSANKLTAGTIDASNINVANLRADSLIVNKLNGQPVFGGYEAVNSNASGYASMNPSTQGWYEISNGQMVATTDTTVSASKAYYTTSSSVALYDQSYIDGLESDLNDRIDGAIETYSGTAVPTLTNYPYMDWYDTTTSPATDNRAEHVGDLYYVVNAASSSDGYCYRFYYDNTTHDYMWVLIKDSDVTAALSDISDLQDFQSETSSWIEETDEGLETIRTNHTTLSGVVDGTVKESVQLWFTKANTTAPSAPTSQVTTNSVSTPNAWNLSVPAYNSSYPNYFYCWQYKFSNNTYGWSTVVRDVAMGESQERARTAVTNAATAQSTANANIKSSVMLWYTSNSTTPPSAPTSQVTSTSTSSGVWTLVVPTYSSSTPRYHYCYQQQKGDGTYQWTTPTYDQATSDSMVTAKAALPASTFTTFQTTTFKDVVDTVDEQSSTITQLTESVRYGGENLLPYSEASAANLAKTGTANTYVSFATEDGYDCYKITGASTQGAQYASNGKNLVTLEADTTYTYSAWVKLTTTGSATSVNLNFVSLGHFTVKNENSTANDKTHEDVVAKRVYSPATVTIGEWTRIQITFTTNSLGGSYFGVYPKYSLGTDYTLFIHSMKLERGPIATPWEYSQGDLTTVSNTVNSVQQTATSNSSTISQLTTTLGTNADGTTATNDVVHRISSAEQDLDGITTRVGKTEMHIAGTFATSSTAAGTAAKVATITPALTGWTLESGVSVTVKFTTANTTSAPTLNVNSTGAKAIRDHTGAALAESAYKWAAGTAYTFTYDGTYWRLQDSALVARVATAESSITQNANNIALKVSESDVTGNYLVGKINLDATTATIAASKVDIQGAAIFTSGRLSQSSLDSAYDAAGSASAAQTAAISAAASDATSKVNAAYNKVLSQGIQLVTNGNGYLGDNTNWPSLTFDGSKANGSPGSLTKTAGAMTLVTSEQFPIDVSKAYLFEFDAMSSDGTARMYSFLNVLDVDGKEIKAHHVFFYPNTLTTLAQDLNPGDTTVTLTSAANWGTTTSDHQRSLIFWDYTNAKGYTYPTETYSQNYYSSLYADDTKVNKTTGVITLKTAWTGPKKVAGTYVSQGRAGSAYDYAHVNVVIPTEWTHFSFVYSGLDTDKNGGDTSGKFRQGTAFAKVGFLWNYGMTSSSPQGQIWVTNVSVKEATSSLSEEQYIYRSAASGTTSMAATTTWVEAPASATASTQNAWTTKRPEYSTDYPVLWVAKQTKRLDGTVTCTTPVKDDTTTVIDGGHITTGTIDAARITSTVVNAINANVSDTINASKINASSLTIGQSQVTNLTSDLEATNTRIDDVALDLYGGTDSEGNEVQSVFDMIDEANETAEGLATQITENTDAIEAVTTNMGAVIANYVLTDTYDADMGDLTTSVASSAERLNNISDDLYGTASTDPAFVSADEHASTKADLENLLGYIHGEVENNVPTLRLGQANSGVTATLTNSSLDFGVSTSSEPVASIGSDDDGGLLKVTRANIGQLDIGEDAAGHWQWQQRKNGNLALKWIPTTLGGE